MSITVRYNTSPMATARMFAVRPSRRRDRIELMRPLADELADTIRQQIDATVIVERFEDDLLDQCFGGRDMTAEAASIARRWLDEHPQLIAENAMALRMASDEDLAIIVRLEALTITDPDVAVSVAHEVASVAYEVLPEMLEYELAFQVIASNEPFDPEVRGNIIGDEFGNVDESAWYGHTVTLPMGDTDVGAVVHEVAHVMSDVAHLTPTGHDNRWGRSYHALLAALLRLGTEDVLRDITAGRDWRSSVEARRRPAIRISTLGVCLSQTTPVDCGLPQFDVLRCLIESWPDELPQRPITCPHRGAMVVD